MDSQSSKPLILGDNNFYPFVFPGVLTDPNDYRQYAQHQHYNQHSPKRPSSAPLGHRHNHRAMVRKHAVIGPVRIRQTCHSKSGALPKNEIQRSLRRIRQRTNAKIQRKRKSQAITVIDASVSGKITSAQIHCKSPRPRPPPTVSPKPKKRRKRKRKKKKEPVVSEPRPSQILMQIPTLKMLDIAKHNLKSMAILKKKRLLSLRRIFHLIDGDDSGNISYQEAVAFNIFIDPSANVGDIEMDCRILFEFIKGKQSGNIKRMFISEVDWLRGWADSVRHSGTFKHIDGFLTTFHSVEGARAVDASHVELCNKFSWMSLQYVLMWCIRAKRRAAKRKSHEAA